MLRRTYKNNKSNGDRLYDDNKENKDVSCPFLQIDDGNGNVLFNGTDSNCDTVPVVTDSITAPARWLKVQFRSDGINATNGFQGVIKSSYVGKYVKYPFRMVAFPLFI